MTDITADDLQVLTQWDTPTICNALEIVTPERRGHGFTVEPFSCLDPALPPMVDFNCPVIVHGMEVVHGDIIHVDGHGAVVVPAEAVAQLPAAIDLISRREAKILAAAQAPDFNIDKLEAAIGAAGDIH